MTSKYFNSRAIQGLNRIGDIFIPHNAEFPSFSELGASDCVDDLIAYVPSDEASLLGTVLMVFSFMPTSWLRALVNKLQSSTTDEGPLGSLFRQLNFGLRGLLFTLYYSDKTSASYTGARPLTLLSVNLNCVED
jgi:hypothetical protein